MAVLTPEEGDGITQRHDRGDSALMPNRGVRDAPACGTSDIGVCRKRHAEIFLWRKITRRFGVAEVGVFALRWHDVDIFINYADEFHLGAKDLNKALFRTAGRSNAD